MNMYDYLNWRGDLTFKQSPFNDVDNLLFCYAIYTDLSEVLKENEVVTIKEACDRLFALHTEEEFLSVHSLIAQAPVVLHRMSETERFGNVKISHYVNEVKDDIPLQFSAAHFEIDKHTAYIAIAGTDDTVTGWKEDFQMSYKTVAAQERAAEYVNSTISPFRKYYLGGHSKGGSLAVYAATQATNSTLHRLIKVYSNDGPGLSPYAYDQKGYDSIKDRIVKIVPEMSVFGMLFDNHEEKMVVKSSYNYFYEHDATSWQIIGTTFEKGTPAPEVELIQTGLNTFLDSMDLEERAAFVDEVFMAFRKADINRISDINKKKLQSLRKLLKEFVKINEDAKKAFANLVVIYGKLVKDKAEGAIFNRIKTVSEFMNDLVTTETANIKNLKTKNRE